MKYDFDTPIDRSGTDAIKLKRCPEIFGTEAVTPLWVADMDFATAPCIRDAIRRRLEHPILGYTTLSDDFLALTQDWIRSHHAWEPAIESIGFIPGIVPALSFAVQCFSQQGDQVIIQAPVYYPFFNVVRNNHRNLVLNPLKQEEGRFKMDLHHLENAITERSRLLILCNPHNPGGRVWTREELLALADVCRRHNLIVVSDEIHADMVLPSSPHPHTPFASVSDWAAQHSVSFMAPSKVFNMPGLISSCYIIPNPALRRRFTSFLEASELGNGNLFAYIATEAAYREGEEWRCQMLDYVQENIHFVIDFLAREIPEIIPMNPEASFLIWLDCRNLGFSNTEELFCFFIQKAGLGLNLGTIFGQGGEHHLRLNVASPRSILKEAMERLAQAVSTRREGLAG